MPIEGPPPKHHFFEIDLLRFVAAFSVLLYHLTYRGFRAGNFSPLGFESIGAITKYGYLGVQLFFIISGYVILLSSRGKTPRQFLTSRAIRLLPAFWACCTLTFLVLKLWGYDGQSAIPQELSARFKDYFINLTMLQEFMGLHSIDAVYWSLTVEISFYFLIAVLLAFRLERYTLAFIILLLAYSALPGIHRPNSLFEQLFFPKAAPYFAAGMLFYLLQQAEGNKLKYYILLLCCYMLAIKTEYSNAQILGGYFRDNLSVTVIATIIAGMFGVILLIVNRKIDFGRYRWLATAGALTYPLYLLHGNISFVIFHRLGGFVDKYVLVGATIACLLLTSYLINRWVELPLRRSVKTINTIRHSIF